MHRLNERVRCSNPFPRSISTTAVSVASEGFCGDLSVSSWIVLLSLDADFLTTVYKYHLQNDNNTIDWDMMYQYCRTAISPQEQIRALIAVSSTNDKSRLLK